MNGYFANPLLFLVHTVFGLYILAVLLRFLLQCARADFYNPLSQFLVKVTNPALQPLRRIIPGLRGVDMAAVVLLVLLELVLQGFTLWLSGTPVGLGRVLMRGVADLLALVFNVYIFSILIQALFSWINTGAYNPAQGLLYALNEPILKPLRRHIAPLGGIDLTPLIAIVGLQVLKMLVLPLVAATP